MIAKIRWWVNNGDCDTLFEKWCRWSDEYSLWIAAGCLAGLAYVAYRVMG